MDAADFDDGVGAGVAYLRGEGDGEEWWEADGKVVGERQGAVDVQERDEC